MYVDQSFSLIGIQSLGKKKADRTHLVLSSMLHYLFIDNLIHDLETLDGLLLCDANIRLLQGHRAETTEKIMQLSEMNVQKVQTHVAVMESVLLQTHVNKT